MFGFPKSELKGYKIADECLEYGLRLGAFIKLSKIIGYIQLMPLSKAVEYGFYKITCYNFQGGEQIFVHQDYKAAFQRILTNAKNKTQEAISD